MGKVNKASIYVVLFLQGALLASKYLPKLILRYKEYQIEKKFLSGKIIILDRHCNLDDTMDGTRASLKTWGTT